MQAFLAYLVALGSRIGSDRSDDDRQRLDKSLLVAVSILVLPPGFIWGLIYLAFGETQAAAIPLAYVVLSPLSIALFARTHHLGLFRFIQLLLILLLPFLLQLALGGFLNSSGVVLWSLLCPLGAIVFATPRQATGWFVAYLLIVIASGFLERVVRVSNNLPPLLLLAFFVMNISAISLIAFVLLSYFVRQKDTAFNLLRLEQEKSENLLYNMLPKSVAAQLKEQALRRQPETIADSFPDTTILFIDIVNFTPLSAELSPQEMVGALNEIFSRFDELVEKHGVEKIETVGDTYMAAAGVPRPRPDHAQAVARAALEICAHVRSLLPVHGRRIDFRMGIHSGPVIAGVIGRTKYAYELWGDTVNTASRMESHGVPGRIQISRATFELIKGEFNCEPRGEIEVKGKGLMETWFLL